MTDVPEGAAILAEQTFGAVVAIRPLDGENEVVRRASATEFGLAACLHTDDPRRIWRPSRALQ